MWMFGETHKKREIFGLPLYCLKFALTSVTAAVTLVALICLSAKSHNKRTSTAASFGTCGQLDHWQTNLVALYCALLRDYLSDAPRPRSMGAWVSQHEKIGCDTSSRSMHFEMQCPPSKGVSQRYLCDAPMKTRQKECHTSSARLARKIWRDMGGVCHTGSLSWQYRMYFTHVLETYLHVSEWWSHVEHGCALMAMWYAKKVWIKTTILICLRFINLPPKWRRPNNKNIDVFHVCMDGVYHLWKPVHMNFCGAHKIPQVFQQTIWSGKDVFLRKNVARDFISQGVSEYGWESDGKTDVPWFGAIPETNRESQQYSGMALGRLRVRLPESLGKPMGLDLEPFLKIIGRANSTRGQP